MSLSETFAKYSQALAASQDRQRGIYDSCSGRTDEFYDTFLNRLVRRYKDQMADREWKGNLLERFRDFFGTDSPAFVAVDGTSEKIQLEEYAVFFAASYGVRGTFLLDGTDSVMYEKRNLNDELSMVAYVPVPFAELDGISGITLDDQSQFSMTDIHNRLMILAEVYLLYSEVTSDRPPNILLWDQTLSGALHWHTPPINEIPMVNHSYEYDGRQLTMADAIICRSHPYNSMLEIPSKSGGFFNIPSRMLYEVFSSPDREARVSGIATLLGQPESQVRRVLEQFMGETETPDGTTHPGCLYHDPSTDVVSLNPRHEDSWGFVVGLVVNLCTRLFRDRDVAAMTYSGRWITAADIGFMISTLLRRMIEVCWEKHILAVGVVKDSASKYFTRNYLGVMRKEGHYSDYEISDLRGLLWSDRLAMERLQIADASLDAPWTTIEYDSVFQTLYLTSRTDPQRIAIRTIPTTERMFARHLTMLYLVRQKGKTIFNHGLFVDRVLLPEFDSEKTGKHPICAQAAEATLDVRPFVDVDNTVANPVLDFVTLFLYSTASNRFPDVMGYPEPLHKADLGAKTFARMVQPMIQSSTMMDSHYMKPWSTSVRAKRRFK